MAKSTSQARSRPWWEDVFGEDAAGAPHAAARAQRRCGGWAEFDAWGPRRREVVASPPAVEEPPVVEIPASASRLAGADPGLDRPVSQPRRESPQARPASGKVVVLSEALLLARRREPPRPVQVSFDSGIDRRVDARRVDARLRVRARLGRCRPWVDGVVTNVSATGLCLLVAGQVARGDRAILGLVPDDGPELRLVGEVRWVAPGPDGDRYAGVRLLRPPLELAALRDTIGRRAARV